MVNVDFPLKALLHSTFIRFLSSLDYSKDGKAELILESFPTIPTLIGLLPSVFLFMNPAFTVMTKGFPAFLTLVRLLFGVDFSMLGELYLVAKSFSPECEFFCVCLGLSSG